MLIGYCVSGLRSVTSSKLLIYNHAPRLWGGINNTLLFLPNIFFLSCRSWILNTRIALIRILSLNIYLNIYEMILSLNNYFEREIHDIFLAVSYPLPDVDIHVNNTIFRSIQQSCWYTVTLPPSSLSSFPVPIFLQFYLQLLIKKSKLLRISHNVTKACNYFCLVYFNDFLFLS